MGAGQVGSVVQPVPSLLGCYNDRIAKGIASITAGAQPPAALRWLAGWVTVGLR
jgi:hypothetical protein